MIRYLVERIKRLHRDKRGFTLIEGLAGLLITGMIVSILYSFLLMGMSMYKKISAETQLRNQANVIFSRIITELQDAVYVQGAGSLVSGDNEYKEIRVIKRAATSEQYVIEDALSFLPEGSDIDDEFIQVTKPLGSTTRETTDIRLFGDHFHMTGTFTVVSNQMVQVDILFQGSPRNRSSAIEDSEIRIKQNIPLFRNE